MTTRHSESWFVFRRHFQPSWMTSASDRSSECIITMTVRLPLSLRDIYKASELLAHLNFSRVHQSKCPLFFWIGKTNFVAHPKWTPLFRQSMRLKKEIEASCKHFLINLFSKHIVLKASFYKRYRTGKGKEQSLRSSESSISHWIAMDQSSLPKDLKKTYLSHWNLLPPREILVNAESLLWKGFWTKSMQSSLSIFIAGFKWRFKALITWKLLDSFLVSLQDKHQYPLCSKIWAFNRTNRINGSLILTKIR